jgi:superfamily I DNA/RNA helicase
VSKIYTEEQRSVIESQASELVVNAFAGTGKTTMLVGYAAERLEQRMLYLAFNKSVAAEAKTRFSSNVDAKTSHSLAFRQFGSQYQDKLGNVKPYHVKNAIPTTYPSDKALLLSEIALGAVNRFITSAKESLLVDFLPAQRLQAAGIDINEAYRVATKTWEMMQSQKDKSMPMTHDGYLKLYQLSKPDLSRYDCILLDEAQDTNPCLFSIFQSQQTHKVLVGDEHQNIYSFRGAMNAMKRMNGERHALTSSFRFGQPIADVANSILNTFKEEDRTLVGLGGESTVIAPQKLYTAFLHRTNAGLFDRAVDLMQTGARIYYVGGIKNYNFDLILDVWNLMDGNRSSVRDPFTKSFPSLNSLEEYAESVDDKEIKARLKVVRKYSFKTPRLIERLEANEEKEVASSHATLTTAHKSKGLEWDQVILGSDFSDVVDDSGVPKSAKYQGEDSEEILSPDEANLIYVAATRAKKNLVINNSLADLISYLKKRQGGAIGRF